MNKNSFSKNYIILAHSNPKQLHRLIHRLNDVDTFFYIHIDLRATLSDFKEGINLSNMFFLEERVKCRWGDISLVEATLLGMKAVLKKDQGGYCLLISGQDYPIKTKAVLNAFLEKNKGCDFIELKPVTELWPGKRWRVRIEQYKFDFSDKQEYFVVIPYFFSKRIFHIFNIWRILKVIIKGVPNLRLILKKRQFPNYLSPFAGSQWWALTTDTLKKIDVFLENHPDYLAYNKYSFCSDEFFFHSIVNYLRENNMTKTKSNFTFVNWKAKEAPSPEILDLRDFDKLIQLPEPYFFARKFDVLKDKEILDQLDKFCRN